MEAFRWGMKKGLQWHAKQDAEGPLYKPLNPRQFRLLYLWADEIDAPLNFSMKRCGMEENITYFALSYVWGDLENIQQIKINGHTVNVTTNLAEALQHFRAWFKYNLSQLSHIHVCLWIDALCIYAS
jgi:hypothetical protein